MDFEEIKQLIQSKIPDAEVEIRDLTGSRDHLGIDVKSDEFKGKMLIKQHQMIMDILKERFKTDLHAVQIKTMTKN